MQDAFEAVTKVLLTYFDGLYHADTARLSKVFHAEAIYASATGGALVHLDMAEYFAVVDQREPPAARNETRRDEIVSITFAGAETALAIVRCAIGEKHFTDVLTLVRLGGEWCIISKVFHFDIVVPASQENPGD